MRVAKGPHRRVPMHSLRRGTQLCRPRQACKLRPQPADGIIAVIAVHPLHRAQAPDAAAVSHLMTEAMVAKLLRRSESVTSISRPARHDRSLQLPPVIMFSISNRPYCFPFSHLTGHGFSPRHCYLLFIELFIRTYLFMHLVQPSSLCHL